MNAEYQRLEAEAKEVEQRIRELLESAGSMKETDTVRFEAEMRRLHLRLSGLHEGMGLLKVAGSKALQKSLVSRICG